MNWEIRISREYEQWFMSLDDAEQISVLAMVDVLEIVGPNLNRPYADTLSGTAKVRNLKELRIQHKGKPYRVFYAFDPQRSAILLCGGKKSGINSKRFYQHMINVAENAFCRHLNFLKKERNQ